jgi:signal transduction histidine kinase
MTAMPFTSHLELSEAMDLARIVYWEIDPASEEFIFNDPFYTFYATNAEAEGGYRMAKEEYGRRFIHPDDLSALHQATRKRTQDRCKEFLHEVEHRIVRRDGEVRHILVKIRAQRNDRGQIIKCYGANQDITERKTAEEELARERLSKEIQLRKEKALEQSREELRNLSEHLQRVRERERTRIAREVHDELGQFLTALKIDLACFGQGFGDKEDGLSVQIEGMTQRIDNAIHAVRKICSELRPSILEDFGLPATIEWHVEDFQKRTGIRFTAKIDPAIPEVEKKLALVVFRVFQEAVTNVVRHAEATAVKVSLRTDGDNLMLKVSDNGKGISKKHLSSPGSLGIIGIRERVRYWNGQLQFRSAPNKGTAVIVSIPLAGQSADAEEAAYPAEFQDDKVTVKR